MSSSLVGTVGAGRKQTRRDGVEVNLDSVEVEKEESGSTRRLTRRSRAGTRPPEARQPSFGTLNERRKDENEKSQLPVKRSRRSTNLERKKKKNVLFTS